MNAENPGPSQNAVGEHEVNLSTARAHLPSYVDYVKQGQTVHLTNRGKRVGVALVPEEVAAHYEELEDAYWARRAEEAEASGTVSWDEAIAHLEGDR